ncbi:MAG: sulfotransferase [Halieaceae bacterium]|nr:sulfotransferase [Halieaceae bacterium]
MSKQEARKAFERAVTLMKEGARDEAEALCRTMIESAPSDANFIALLGSIVARKGNLEESVSLLRRAIAIAPGNPNAQADLGTALLNLGRAEDALRHLEKARSLSSADPSLLSKLAGAYQQTGDVDNANKVMAEAAILSPSQAKLDQATRLFVEGEFREAEKLAKELVRENPRDVNAALLLARLAIKARCFKDAQELLERIIELAPGFIAARHDLGTVLKETHKHEDAVDVLREAVGIDVNNALSHYYLGAALAMAAKPREAVDSYQRAVELDPMLPGGHIGLGHVLKTVGNQSAGIDAYKRAIELRPNYGETYYSLANLKTFRFSKDEIASMESRLENENLPTDCRVHFAFALAKAYEDEKNFDESFEHYALANQMHRETIAYDPVQTQVGHERMRDVFDKNFFYRTPASSGCAAEDPIFIVGLPRSGSTLLEQILASHSQVDGTSELHDISLIAQGLSRSREGNSFPQSVANMAPEQLCELGEKYLSQTRQYRGAAPFFTDKMPNNFAYVGFIKAILPNAKIIDARRHPMDSCFGSFKQHFAKGQTFTYDLFELGEFYLEYDQLMLHWYDVLEGQILRVQYETVVNDLEDQVRRILDFCELPFEEACLNFHETERAVRTASSEQVRQPIYSSSVGTWRHFEQHLGALKEILAPVLPPEKETTG